MLSPTHLLSTHGILTSFSIGRKIDKKRLNKMIQSLKKTKKYKNKSSLNQQLSDDLIKDTIEKLNLKMVPGLILPEIHPKKKRLDSLYSQSSDIAGEFYREIIKNGLTKKQICFLINKIVNLTELSENDFERFREEYSRYMEDDFDDIE